MQAKTDNKVKANLFIRPRIIVFLRCHVNTQNLPLFVTKITQLRIEHVNIYEPKVADGIIEEVATKLFTKSNVMDPNDRLLKHS